jgi:hypothetical protein
MEGTEMRRRLEAARGYGGFRGREDFGVAVDMSPSTQQRVERGDRALGPAERLLISKVCDVPEWFLEGGWDGWRQEDGDPTEIQRTGEAAKAQLERAGDRRKAS